MEHFRNSQQAEACTKSASADSVLARIESAQDVADTEGQIFVEKIGRFEFFMAVSRGVVRMNNQGRSCWSWMSYVAVRS